MSYKEFRKIPRNWDYFYEEIESIDENFVDGYFWEEL